MSLFSKILLSMLLVALVPLLATSLLLSFNLGKVRETLAARIAETSDRQASESLRLQAEQVAEDLAALLKNCENDVTLLASLHGSPALLKKIYDSRTSEIWYRRGTLFGPREIREWVPLYSSLAVIDARGRETFVIHNGTILSPGRFRDVSNPRNTEFLSEDYFEKTKRMKPGEVYVSHVTGFHLGKEEQLAGATDPEHAVDGKEFRGVVRFATQVTDDGGRFNGIVVLSLDHRHLMERSQHILPGGNSRTVFPSYKSGNYAFIFDDEGWIITHPKFWDIRGADRTGKLVPPYSAESSQEDIAAGRIPYNLDHAGFIHPNYPVVARMVRAKQSGYVDITNVGGAKKIMAFAPIHYSTGDYSRHGIFGAVTIGFQVDQFHELARTGVALINGQLQEHISASIIIITLTCLMVGISAWALSRGITRPLGLLMEGSREMASGFTGKRVEVKTNDEIGQLAADFNMMAEELERRKDRLLSTLDELEQSRREILAERNFKEEVLESISSAILTFAPTGTLLSVNETGRQLLGASVRPGQYFADIFQGWSDMADRIARVLAGVKGFGREPLIVTTAEESKHYSVGFFPIKGGAEAAITVTIRDDTEKERMREEMIRMDRLASLGKLAAGLAHEIRNPLTGVSLLLDDLHDRAAPESECQLLMGKALGEIERVERLITSLLNFSSPPKAQFQTGEINGVVNDILLLLRRECDRQGVTLQFDPGEVPIFQFDKEKIKQAVLNLLKNAMEALPEGGTITVSTTASDDMANITVTDTGPGIPADSLPLIFEPFFTCKGAGTGLGLSITERIIQEHHGRVTVDTSEKGTAFTLALPLCEQ
jgi:signal transduction histidine kinase/HAMP domain-containing protein